jgi:hypothetical protein
MDPLLRSRISALIGEDLPMEFQQGGEVDSPDMVTPEMEMMRAQAEQGVIEGATKDPNESLAEYISALMVERDATQDPMERSQLEHMAEAAELSTNAPLAEQAFEVAAQGRGEDTALAHLRPGEVVLPPEMFEDARFEEVVESRFNELDLDPEAYVVGLGIASLNPITGLEEFGFFKKVAKSIKKVAKRVVRPLAQVAQFIPGPWSGIAALVNKAFTVYDVAKGDANPLALLTVAGPLATGGGIGENIADIKAAGDGNFLRGLGKGLADSGTAIREGIGSLVSDPLGTIKELSESPTFSGQPKRSDADILDELRITGTPDVQAAIEIMGEAGSAPEEIFKELVEKHGVNPATFFNSAEGQTGGIFDQIGSRISGQPGQQTPFQEFLDDQLGIDPSGGGIFNLLKGGQDGQGGQGGLGGLLGGGGLKNLGTMGIAGILAKLAYDEAKNRRGVPLTPLTQEGATGRYNIEAEIARRTGQPAPNPVEFGLLPTGTLPTLSGGRAAPVEEEAVMNARYGGPVMAFAKGGDVAKKDFVEMDGTINGPGTEVSDDIPAMLSDGEFVMTGQAVRGAGAFDLATGDGGIITLTPNGSENRDKGTNLMYEMMDLFSEFADKPKSERAAA